MATDLEQEKVNQSILDHIILGVAHELNNPNTFVRLNMANIKKMLSLLQPCFDEFEHNHPAQKFGPYTLNELRAKLMQLLESTLGATERIITVADKLKQCTSFALSQSEGVSVLEVIQNVIVLQQFLIEKWAKVEVVFDAKGDYVIDGYRLQLEQGLAILLTNACDAISERYQGSDEVKGLLTITLTQLDNAVQVTFKDNGTGIDEAIKDKIFTPYFTTKPQGVGDGLGLPLCLAIIERHGGTIDFKSENGVGTEFIVVLPKQNKCKSLS